MVGATSGGDKVLLACQASERSALIWKLVRVAEKSWPALSAYGQNYLGIRC